MLLYAKSSDLRLTLITKQGKKNAWFENCRQSSFLAKYASLRMDFHTHEGSFLRDIGAYVDGKWLPFEGPKVKGLRTVLMKDCP